MDLSLIKDYFTCLANVQDKRFKKTTEFLKQFPRLNAFSLFKQLSINSTPELDNIKLKKYLTQFTSNLQIVQPHQIQKYSNTKEISNKKNPTEDQIIQKGINLFLNSWGNDLKIFTFKQFSLFIKGQQCLPQKAQQVTYMAKKKMHSIFEEQIQGLLNTQTLRQLCIKQYRNLTDLFEVISNGQTHKINKVSLKNLYLLHSQRIDQLFLDHLEKRLSLPLNFQNFMKMFKSNQKLSSKTVERKVFYSSVKKKKDNKDFLLDQDQCVSHVADNYSNISSSRYQTPTISKGGVNRNATSTKLTKGDKIQQLKQASVNVSRFSFQSSPSFGPKQIQLLGQILHIQQSFIQLKRNLILQRDLDIQLVYQRHGQKFLPILNNLYGLCNFTSFIRFLVPHDYQHKSLAFIRYQSSNKISSETINEIDNLIEQFYRKQEDIQILWQKIDREMLFRMYCNPCDKNIKVEQLNKYFTQRQVNVLLDRMDPYKTGEITYDSFK